MNNIQRKPYIVLAILFLLSASISAVTPLKELKNRGNAYDNAEKSSLEPDIFFTAYRQEKTIELWVASINPNSVHQVPQYTEPGKYSFDLLPSEERFYLGYSDQTGEYYNTENFESQYTWGPVQVSPENDVLLWVESAMFYCAKVNYPCGGIEKIIIWNNDKKEKKNILELPYHIDLFAYQMLLDVTWSPTGQLVSYKVYSKQSGFERLKVIDIDTLEITEIGEDVSRYLWSPNGKYIAYNTRDYKRSDLVIADLMGNRMFSTEDHFSTIFSYTWSPDEKKIIITAIDKEGKKGVYLINLQRKNTEKLFELPNTEYDYSKALWSPDGKYIAFKTSSEEDNNGQLYIVDAKKLTTPQLVEDISVFGITPHQYTWGKMEWSQDGEILAINGKTNDKAGIHFIDPTEARIVSSFYPDTFAKQWMFTENNSTIIALIRSEDFSCPKEEIDELVYYNWKEEAITKLNFNPILETYLKECELTIDNFVYEINSALDFGH